MRILTIIPVCVVKALSLSSMLLSLGCPEDPGVSPVGYRGPREYSWVRDTIGDGSFQSTLFGIWGTSGSDAYVVGHSSSPGIRKIWHFDGTSWSDWSNVYGAGFQIGGEPNYTPFAVFGFASNDVWIVGGRESPDSAGARVGFVLRKKGGAWEGVILPGSDPHTKVWGRSPDDVWIGGFGGRTYHFDGVNYSRFQLPDSAIVHQIIGPNNGPDVFVSGLVPQSGPDLIRYYHWNGSQWTMTDSKTAGASSPAMSSASSMHEGTLISVDGHSITRKVSANSWQTVFEDPTAYFWDIWFASKDEGFAVGTDTGTRELVYHYNGTDWKKIGLDRNVDGGIVEAWSCQTTVMFVSEESTSQGTAWPRSYVMRGQ